MVAQSLNVHKDLFWHEGYEKLLGLEVPYINAIGTLMYLANNTWLLV